jgi:hypothetical protein
MGQKFGIFVICLFDKWFVICYFTYIYSFKVNKCDILVSCLIFLYTLQSDLLRSIKYKIIHDVVNFKIVGYEKIFITYIFIVGV